MRVPYGEYAEYHTSLDNKECIRFSALAGSVEKYAEMVRMLESNVVWSSLVPQCDPCLGARGLYPTLSVKQDYDQEFQAVFWLLSYVDGEHDLLAISEISGIDMDVLITVTERFAKAGLIISKD